MAHLGTGSEGGEGAQERLLHDVLRAPVGAHPARVGEKLGSISLDDRGERPFVSCPREARQPLIGLTVEVAI
jgi:hypothetical protein